jgi:hypothetical protein
LKQKQRVQKCSRGRGTEWRIEDKRRRTRHSSLEPSQWLIASFTLSDQGRL